MGLLRACFCGRDFRFLSEKPRFLRAIRRSRAMVCLGQTPLVMSNGYLLSDCPVVVPSKRHSKSLS